MTKIVPVLMIIIAVFGFIFALIGLVCAFAADSVPMLGAASAILLFLSCAANAAAVVQGIILKSKICLTAMIIGITSYLMTFIGFVVLYSI